MNPTKREKIAKLFADASKRSVQIDDKVCIFIGEGCFAAADEAIAKALKRGATIRENGKSTWIEYSMVFDHTKSGSAAFTWRGEKVKVEHIKVTTDGCGTSAREVIGYSWRNYE
jgi:hypothetical protein